MTLPDPQRPDADKSRRQRNVVLALALGVFVLLVFLVTMAKIKAGTLH